MPATFDNLKPMTDGIEPITVDQRHRRVDKARGLMAAGGIDALFLEPGSSLVYFLGVEWWASERMMAAIVPAQGDIAYVCPAFEEARLREMLTIGDEVRVWQEHESPCKVAAGILKDRGAAAGRLAMGQTVRFFVFDGIGGAAPQVDLVSGEAVVLPCRGIKSAAEIALIQRAMDITVEAYKATLPLLREGMSREEFAALAADAHKALGAKGGITCQFGQGTAYPHGSAEPERLADGDVVLMDGGCTVEGYHSDISRTIVFGEPTQRQRDIWNLEAAAQAAAFAAAQVGVPCEDVDAAARKVITDAGFGPDYEVPGLPHRTGHGIGLDIHECWHLVRGNKTPLAAGMCFSNEPMIAIYGEFGVRLEDCMYITEAGPRFFTQPSASIDQPFA